MSRILPMGGTVRRALLLKTGQVVSYGSGTGVDDGALQIGVAKSYGAVLTAGQYSGTTNITINSKTDAHSNNCVVDLNTGRMWNNTVSASVGPASDGKLPWTTTGSGGTAEGIFPYVAAANAASLSGYTDWRIPNDDELMSIRNCVAATAIPNATAFPSFPAGADVWTSTSTSSNAANYGREINFLTGASANNLKTNNYYCILVRG